MNDAFMKEKPILGLVLSMSLPMVLSMLVNSLYNIVDSYFVASISEEAMTALSLVYPIQNLINAITIGFGVGINATIAFYLGAQRKEQADRAASAGFFINAVSLGVKLANDGLIEIVHQCRKQNKNSTAASRAAKWICDIAGNTECTF